MLKEEYKIYEEKMKKSIESVVNDFDTVRAGRANASVLNRISVDYYPHPHPADRLYRFPRPPHAGHYAVGCLCAEGHREGYSGVRSGHQSPERR